MLPDTKTTPNPVPLYRLAGAGALLAFLLVLLDMAMSFSGGDAATGSLSAAQWFAVFQQDWFLGLRNLGIFNMISPLLTLPLYLALYRLHRQGAPTGATLAMALFLLGAAVYGANNRALAMLSLSQQYAAAGTAQRALLEAAGTALLAQAEDFTPGSFPGFFLSSVGSIWMMAVLLRARVFRKWHSLTGLLGSSLLLAFTISVTFAPATFDLAMIVAMLGGLLMLAWQLTMVIAMFRLGIRPAQAQAKPASAARPA